MADYQNAFALLEDLRKRDEKKVHEMRSIRNFLGMKAREKGIPISGQFELTPLCNFDCKMCYVHLEPDQLNHQSILSVDTWKDLMHQAWEAGMMSLNLTGGECLAYPGFDELFLYLQSLGCEVGVLTNGYLMDEKRIQFFKKHLPSQIQVSLYGWNDDVYERVTGQRAYTTVVKNIKRATEENLPVFITITPNAYLGEDLFETIRVAKELSNSVMMNSYIASPRVETGRSEQNDDVDLELYIRAYKYCYQLEGSEVIEIAKEDLPPCGGPHHKSSECGLRCGGGRSGFMIDWKGVMMPCTKMDMIRGYPLTEGFTAAWAKINQQANRWPRVPECDGCAYNGVCNTCAANMLRFASPGKLPIGLCEQTKEFVRHGVKHLPECE